MLSVALVAVSIGLRLVEGTMTLHAGLLVLILVPEVYLPLRMVGMHFHAAAEGARCGPANGGDSGGGTADVRAGHRHPRPRPSND